jgi:hypothetical protein
LNKFYAVFQVSAQGSLSAPRKANEKVPKKFSTKEKLDKADEKLMERARSRRANLWISFNLFPLFF